MSPDPVPLPVPRENRVRLELPATRALPRRLLLVSRDGCMLAYLFSGSRKGSTTELVYAAASVGACDCDLASPTLHVGSASIPLTRAEAEKVAETFSAAGLRLMGVAA